VGNTATNSLKLREAAGDVRWIWTLAAGTGAGVLPQLLLYPIIYGYVLASYLLGQDGWREQSAQFGYLVGAWGLPLLQMLLVMLAASWVARRVGAALAHGVLIALVSVIAGQAAGLYHGPLDLVEVAKYLVLALASGLLGATEGQSMLAGQKALYRASQDIGFARDPRTIVDALDEHLASLETAGIALWQAALPESGAREAGSKAQAWVPWFSRIWPVGARFEGMDVEALAEAGKRTTRTLSVNELPTVERAAWRSQGIRSVLLVPLRAPDDSEVGLLLVASKRRRFPRSAARAYLTVGAQVALVLENMRLFEVARRTGRETGVLRERERMAREIHDSLAQGFTSIVMNLEAADGVLDGNLPAELGEARDYLDRSRLTARESLTEARRLVWALGPEPLESASLPDALGRLVDRWGRESGIAASIVVTGTPLPLPRQTEAALFRMAQEALGNTRKYARASRTALTLSYMGDTVALDSRDDGVGFIPGSEPLSASEGGGFGLRAMRERIEGIGGILNIESAPGEGTVLAVELPVDTVNLSQPDTHNHEVLGGTP
jgi:signal transduction histidine kinase